MVIIIKLNHLIAYFYLIFKDVLCHLPSVFNFFTLGIFTYISKYPCITLLNLLSLPAFFKSVDIDFLTQLQALLKRAVYQYQALDFHYMMILYRLHLIYKNSNPIISLNSIFFIRIRALVCNKQPVL